MNSRFVSALFLAVVASPATAQATTRTDSAVVAKALDAVFDHLDIAEGALGHADPIGELRGWFIPASAARVAWPPAPSAPLQVPAHPAVLLRLGRAGGWITDVAADGATVTAVRPQ